ncbi:hypothetical protein OIU85_011020 [Salix viminalis]|uniref:VQ domain-containing protein n=1 Tax=Salix viminalis TaxID=40686 RepID=A0A9Q0NS15_SALVM|nr:hypothetical protein OIU85_011020 [Salix viminalis]
MRSQQFSNSIEALRPDVYIADTSKFKTLVQELTGNYGKGHGLHLLPPPESSSPQIIQKAPFIDVEYQEHDRHESSMETSVEESKCSFV